MNTLLNIHSVIKTSRVNGPGLRLVVFTQGCNLNCEGCFNTALHPFEGGQKINPATLLKEHYSKDLEGITVSGGEPFAEPTALQALLKRAKEEYALSTVVYSGFDYAKLLEKTETADALKYIDVLIDGAFKVNMLEKTLLARGSKNQNFIFLTDRYTLKDFYMPGKVEISIDKNGVVTSTGFSDPGFKVKDAI